MQLAKPTLARLGEWRAAWLYRLRGYRVVARNLRIGGGEIDLVAKRGNTLVVAEVKTRQSVRAGEGLESVDERKQRQLARLGELLLLRERVPMRVRYDVVSLYWTGFRFVVRFIPDAFRPA